MIHDCVEPAKLAKLKQMAWQKQALEEGDALRGQPSSDEESKLSSQASLSESRYSEEMTHAELEKQQSMEVESMAKYNAEQVKQNKLR